MSVNRFDRPAQQEYVDQYVPVPFQELMLVANQRQKQFEDVKTQLEADKDALLRFNTTQHPVDLQAKKDIQSKYSGMIDEAVNQSKGDYSKLNSFTREIGRQIKNDYSYGDIANLQHNYEQDALANQETQKLKQQGKYNPALHYADYGQQREQYQGFKNQDGTYNRLNFGGIREHQDIGKVISDFTQQWTPDQNVKLSDSRHGYFIKSIGKWVDKGEVENAAANYIKANPILNSQVQAEAQYSGRGLSNEDFINQSLGKLNNDINNISSKDNLSTQEQNNLKALKQQRNNLLSLPERDIERYKNNMLSNNILKGYVSPSAEREAFRSNDIDINAIPNYGEENKNKPTLSFGEQTPVVNYSNNFFDTDKLDFKQRSESYTPKFGEEGYNEYLRSEGSIKPTRTTKEKQYGKLTSDEQKIYDQLANHNFSYIKDTDQKNKAIKSYLDNLKSQDVSAYAESVPDNIKYPYSGDKEGAEGLTTSVFGGTKIDDAKVSGRYLNRYFYDPSTGKTLSGDKFKEQVIDKLDKKDIVSIPNKYSNKNPFTSITGNDNFATSYQVVVGNKQYIMSGADKEFIQGKEGNKVDIAAYDRAVNKISKSTITPGLEHNISLPTPSGEKELSVTYTNDGFEIIPKGTSTSLRDSKGNLPRTEEESLKVIYQNLSK